MRYNNQYYPYGGIMAEKKKQCLPGNRILAEIIREIRQEKKKRCAFPFWNNWNNWTNWNNWGNWGNW